MKKLAYLLFLAILISCRHSQKTLTKTAAVPAGKVAQAETPPAIRYSDKQIETFLDSVGNLPVKALADKVAFAADSAFKSQKQLDTLISPANMKILRRAAHKGVMPVKTARRIFKNDSISYDCNAESVSVTYKRGLIPVEYYPFDKNKNTFDEYAIGIGNRWHCSTAILYFFKGSRIIAVHDGYHHYSNDIDHYKDADGKTVVYYVKGFTDGSGIWWNNYFFYKYDGNKLIPVLNEVQNANLLQPSPWGARELWLEATIQKTNPLTMKMVYHQRLPDAVDFDHRTADTPPGPGIVNDSTIVQYTWDEATKTLKGQYNRSKISKSQILSYYLEDNELLFINTYYNTLKSFLADKKKRAPTLHYLNLVKNYCCGQRR